MTTLSFDVLWKDRGAAKGLKDLGTGADQAHGKMSKFTGMAGKGLKVAGGAVAGFGVAAVAALGAAGIAGAAMGVKVASGNEQAKISFTTMLGSAKKADSFLRELQKFAAETPFEFPELQTAASSLISAGINANKVVPIMRTLGDVTSGMGTGSEGVQRATVALQQMAAAGRITGEDLNQLRDAGIPVYDLLSKATGKSKEEVVKLAQAGKLGKKELGQMMDALESGKGLERFSGLMEKQSKSLAGTWSTLKDTIGQGLGNVMANSLPLLKQGITGISNVATGAFAWVDKNKASIGAMFKAAGSSLSAFGRIAAGTFSAFIGSTGDGTASFKSFADYLSTHQADIIRGFVSAGKGALLFGRTLATSASTGLKAFSILLDGITTGTQGVLATVRTMAAGYVAAFGWIPGLGPKLKGALTAFDEFSATAVKGSRKAADGARGLADGIDKKVIPSIDKGAAALDKFGRKEVVKAAQRDQVAKFALALKTIPKEKRAEIRAIAKTKGVGEAMKEIKKVKDKEAKIKVSSDAKKKVADSNKETSKARGKSTRIDVNSNAKSVTSASNRATGNAKGKNVKIDVNSNARSVASAAQRSINSVRGKSVTITTYRKTVNKGTSKAVANAYGGKIASGSTTPRADDVTVMASRGEWWIQEPASRKYGDRRMAAVNDGTARVLLPGEEMRARGGVVGRGQLLTRPQYVMAGGGAAAIHYHSNVTVNAPNYVGPEAQLAKAINDLDRRGALDGVARKWAKRNR